VKSFGRKTWYLFMKSLSKFVLCIHICSFTVFMHSLFHSHTHILVSTKMYMSKWTCRCFHSYLLHSYTNFNISVKNLYSIKRSSIWKKINLEYFA